MKTFLKYIGASWGKSQHFLLEIERMYCTAFLNAVGQQDEQTPNYLKTVFSM